MSKKLAIYCDCDSDSGMLTYTLMLLTALKDYSDINTFVITSSPRNQQEQERLYKLQKNSGGIFVLSRNYSSSKKVAQELNRILVNSGINYYIPNYRYMPHLALSYLPRNIKNIIIVHNDTEEIYQSIRFYFSAIDGVIFPSRSAFAKSNNTIPGIVNKVCIPHYFSALGDGKPRSEKEDRLIVVYHGRLAHAQKKSMELLQIALQLNILQVPFTLKIIGAGDALKDIRQKVKDEAIANVELIGQLGRDQLIQELCDADIALSTSTYEGFCYSVAESLSLGIVPVVYENEVLHDLIQNGVNGYLLPWGRADLVALKIQELHQNPQQRLAMSNAAIKSVESLISAERYARQMTDFLKILDNAPVGRAWPIFRPRGLAYDTLLSRTIARFGRKLNFW